MRWDRRCPLLGRLISQLDQTNASMHFDLDMGRSWPIVLMMFLVHHDPWKNKRGGSGEGLRT